MLKVGNIVDIRRLRDEGLSKSQVAKRLGLNRRTVNKYWDGETEFPSTSEYKERASVLASWMDYIKDRLEKYPELSAKRLYGEVKKRGYSGSERTVRREVAKIRPADARAYTPPRRLSPENKRRQTGGTLARPRSRLPTKFRYSSWRDVQEITQTITNM
ncbi:MAG: hypothetical protein ACM3WU_05140 [Bacillota bacterium]